MLIRRMTKWDYDAVDRLLLQLQQADARSRPDMFAPMAHYMRPPRRGREGRADRLQPQQNRGIRLPRLRHGTPAQYL